MHQHTIDTSRLRVGYEEHHPQGRRTVVLLHGWPDSLRTWDGVAPGLAAQGWRVIVPALRGFLPTRFLHADTPRSGQLSALGRDLLEFIDALELQQPALVGHDWGARAAANACGLRPGVASHLAMLAVGYGTNLPSQALDMAQVRRYWYHWFMATPLGERTLREQRQAFARTMWDTWAPPGWYTDAEFDAAAAAFAHDDWPAVSAHSYSHRWGHAPGDPAYDDDEARLNPAPVLDLPTLVLHGQEDAVNPPEMSASKEGFFRGRYQRQLMPGVGHFPQREAPQAVLALLSDFLSQTG